MFHFGRGRIVPQYLWKAYKKLDSILDEPSGFRYAQLRVSMVSL